MEETGVPEEYHWHAAAHWQTMYIIQYTLHDVAYMYKPNKFGLIFIENIELTPYASITSSKCFVLN